MKDSAGSCIIYIMALRSILYISLCHSILILSLYRAQLVNRIILNLVI